MASCSTAEGIVAKADLVLYFQQGSARQLAPDLRAKRRKTNPSRANQMISRHSPNLHAIPWISLYCYSYNIIIIKATQRATCIYTENSCKERGKGWLGEKLWLLQKLQLTIVQPASRIFILNAKKCSNASNSGMHLHVSICRLKKKKKSKTICSHPSPSFQILTRDCC